MPVFHLMLMLANRTVLIVISCPLLLHLRNRLQALGVVSVGDLASVRSLAGGGASPSLATALLPVVGTGLAASGGRGGLGAAGDGLGSARADRQLGG